MQFAHYAGISLNNPPSYIRLKEVLAKSTISDLLTHKRFTLTDIYRENILRSLLIEQTAARQGEHECHSYSPFEVLDIPPTFRIIVT